MGFEKEEVERILSQLRKAMGGDRFWGFNKKFKGKTRLLGWRFISIGMVGSFNCPSLELTEDENIDYFRSGELQMRTTITVKKYIPSPFSMGMIATLVQALPC